MTTITFERDELVRKLARLSIRTLAGENDILFHHVAKYMAECAREFDLTDDEQQLFVSLIVKGEV